MEINNLIMKDSGLQGLEGSINGHMNTSTSVLLSETIINELFILYIKNTSNILYKWPAPF